MKKWERFTRQEIEQFVNESISYAQLAEKIGYSSTNSSGSVSKSIKQMIEELGLDISHFKGQGWSKDNFDYSRFKYGKEIRGVSAINAIIALRGHRCECCENSTWNKQQIPLQIHHIDGNGLNNELTNLQLLCPNCHAQTDNYCGKNKDKKNISDEDFVSALRTSKNIYQALIKLGNVQGRLYQRAYQLIEKYNITFPEKYTQEEKENRCVDCGTVIHNTSKRCHKCEGILRTKEAIARIPISREDLKQLIKNKSFLEIGKQFGVSDNLVRKWCDWFDLPRRTSEIKKYSDEEWGHI